MKMLRFFMEVNRMHKIKPLRMSQGLYGLDVQRKESGYTGQTMLNMNLPGRRKRGTECSWM